MSDNNDKKPASPVPGWPSTGGQARPDQPEGHMAEDPLAELDRIVNQDFGQSSGNGDQTVRISNDDLQLLEQELIRELRGAQEAPQVAVPTEPDPSEASAHPEPAPSAGYVHSQAEARESDPLLRPHPLAPSSHEQGSPAHQDAPAVSTKPVAPMPSASSAGREEGYRSAPSLDDWSDLVGAKRSEPEPAKPPVSPRAYEPEPSEDDPIATSGSYGQLKRPSQSPRSAAPTVSPDYRTPADQGYAAKQESSYQAPRDPLAGYRPGQSYDRDLQSDHRSAPKVSSSWDEAVAEPNDPEDVHTEPTYGYRHEPEPVRRSYSVASHEPYRENETYYGSRDAVEEEPVDPYASREVPEVTAPVTSGASPDPFAAFNQTQADPYASYRDPHEEQGYGGSLGAAPAVDVTGRGVAGGSYGAGAAQRGYSGDTHYDETSAAPAAPSLGGYDRSYQSNMAPQADIGSDGYPMASGPHGSYADPNVAAAAAESAPYLQDEDYPTMDMEGASVESEPKKSRKTLVAALAAVGVVVVGGLIAWGYGQSGSSGDTEPPVIVANTDPVKETPEDPGGKIIPHQNQAVYDRIDGTESDEGPSKLMPATETPMAMTADGQSPRVISLSGGESSVSQSSSSEAGGAVAPKKVRTVVVRPDGTFVTSDGGTDTANANSVDNQLLNATPSEQAMSQTFNTGVDQNVGSDGTTTLDAGAQATAPLPREKPAELVALQAAAESTAVSTPVASTPAPALQTTQPTSNPISLVPPTNQAATTNPAPAVNTSSGGGGYTVQITSQRSPEQARASFNNIQARLPSVLSGYQPDIKEADLGDRGIYYRVRVGSFADRDGAISFCEQIKAAGGDCLVAQK